MAESYWIKLDHHWRDDPKVMVYEAEHGKAALVDVIELFCLMSEFGGVIDLGDKGARLRCEKQLGLKGAKLDRFVDSVAACGIVSAEWWDARGIVGSERSLRDAQATATAAAKAAREAKASGGDAGGLRNGVRDGGRDGRAFGTVTVTVTDSVTVSKEIPHLKNREE